MFGEFNPKLQGVKSKALTNNFVNSITGANGIGVSSLTGDIALSLGAITPTSITCDSVATGTNANVNYIFSGAKPVNVLLQSSKATKTNNTQLGIWDTSYCHASTNINLVTSLYSNQLVDVPATFTVSVLAGVAVSPNFSFSGTGTITNHSAFYFDGGTSSPTQTVTNSYGIYLAEPAQGTNKFAGNFLGRVQIGTTGQFDVSRLGVVTAGTWQGTSIDGTYLNYNTTNLKVTASQLNTIQDINSTAAPTFGGLSINGSATFDASGILNNIGVLFQGAINTNFSVAAGLELNHALVVSSNSSSVRGISIEPGFTVNSATITDAIGCYVGVGGQTGSAITNGYGFYAEEPAYGTNKYAANLKGRVTIGTTGQFDISRIGVITAGTWNGSSIATTYTDAKVTSISGTSNRITVGGTATVPTVDISTSYVGQNTITTLGTIATGIWQGTVIGGSFLNYNTTNLKVTASQINTIQNIATNSSPFFSKIGTSITPVVEMHAQLASSDPIVGTQNGGNSIFGMQSDSDNGMKLGVYSGSNITNQLYISKAGNIGLFSSPSAGGGTSVLFLANSASIPGSNPTAGYIIYSQSGALKGRGTSGTVTTIGNADPHCPICGSDFAAQWENDIYGGELRVCKICEIDYISKNHRMIKALSDHVLGNATAITADDITNFYSADPAYFLWNSERTDEYRGVRMPAIETR